MTTETERLRRELRAMGAVNRQLQAQLDEPVSATKQRRSTPGGEWIERLSTKGSTTPQVVRSSQGNIFVVEGDEKRPVRSGVLAAAIEEAIGQARDATDTQLASWTDGIPVEIFEAPDGAPFIVVGGKRRTIRGVPLPYPVSNKQASEFAVEDDVNVAAANVPRRKYQQAISPQFQLDRIKALVREKGVAGTGKAVVRRARKKPQR